MVVNAMGYGWPTVVVFLVLLLAAVFTLVMGPIIGDQLPDGDRSWLWWILASFVLGGLATATLSVRAVLWYVVVWGGVVVLAALGQGLALLVELAGDFAGAFGLGGLLLGGVFLSASFVAALTGHQWWSLIGLVAALSAVGLSSLLLLEDDPSLSVRLASTVAAIGGPGVAVVAAALIVLGPWVALTVDGAVIPRVFGALMCVALGGIGLQSATWVITLHLESRPASAGRESGPLALWRAYLRTLAASARARTRHRDPG